MVETLLQLWALQQLDNELTILHNKKSEIPKKIEGLISALTQEKKRREDSRHRLTELKKNYKLAEVDLKSIEEKIEKLSAQLYNAKSNEEYKAFLKEIETLKNNKATLEDQMVNLLEETEETEKLIKSLDKEVEVVETETKEHISRLNNEQARIESAVAEREGQQKKVIESLKKDFYAVYERIRKSKGGIAVVTINNERCGGCISPIPPQKILEINQKDRLHFCEYCGRIIIPQELTI